MTVNINLNFFIKKTLCACLSALKEFLGQFQFRTYYKNHCSFYNYNFTHTKKADLRFENGF